jgi:peroxiredoxin
MNSTKRFRNLAAGFVLLASIAGCMEEPIQVLQVGAKAPPFTLELLNGEKSELDLYSGKSLAITFMSSWCPCSNDSIPLMNAAYTDNKDKNLAFLMVGIQDSRAKFRQFVEKWRIPFPAGYDEGNRIAREYGIHSPPTTVFIDRNGDVKRVFYGNIDEKKDEFPQWIEEIL